MTMRLLAVLLLMSIANIGAAWAQAKDETQPGPRTLEELDKRLAEIVAKEKLAGANIAIVEKNVLVFAKGYGLADVAAKRPMTPETVMRAGSISKSFTGVLAAMLAEEGKLDLTMTLKDALPGFAFENPWEATDPVRLVHLIEHTSGFDDIDFHHYLLEGKVPLAEAAVAYGPYKSRWKPGTLVSYCNAGPVIVAHIMERVTGQTFETLMRDRLHAPLGMQSAHWTKEPAIAALIAKSYKSDGVTEEPFVEIYGRPAGSLNVTPKDLARFAMLMNARGALDARPYFKPETATRIETPTTSAGVKAGLKLGYGLGIMAYPGKKTMFHGHDGGIDGFAAKLEYAPAIAAGLVIMVNGGQGNPFELVDPVKDYLERDLPALVQDSVPLPEGAAARWAGFYQTIAPRQEKLRIISDLAAWPSAGVDAQGRLTFNGRPRVHMGNGVFRREDRAGPSLVFADGPEGVRLYTAIGADRQVPLWEVVSKAAYGAVFAIAALASLLFALVWIIGALRGRLGERGGVLVRLVPFLALASVAVLVTAALLPLSANDLMQLAKPSGAGWTVYGASLAVPALGALSLLAALTASRATPMFAWLLLWTNTALTLVAALFLYHYGWIGMKFWE